MNRVTMLEGYGEATALPPNAAAQFEEISKNVIADLRRSIYWLGIKIQASPFLTSETKRGLLSTRGTWNATTDRLEKNIADVMLGMTAPSKWLAACATIADGIEGTAGLIKEENYFRFMSDRMDDAAAKIAKLAAALEKGLDTSISLSQYALPALIIGGIGIVLFHLNRVGSSVRLSGGRGLGSYRRRKRRR